MSDDATLGPDTPIENAGFSVRAFKCLKVHYPGSYGYDPPHDIRTLGDLARCSEKQLLRVPNLWHVTLNEIKEVLERAGLELAPKHND
jgi:DNA-directed RNA polymerase alpha subunit